MEKQVFVLWNSLNKNRIMTLNCLVILEVESAIGIDIVSAEYFRCLPSFQ